jgi:hypothetical protein
MLLREKSRSLASENDAKAGEQSVFIEIHTIHVFGVPSCRNFIASHFGLANEVCGSLSGNRHTDRQTDRHTE